MKKCRFPSLLAAVILLAALFLPMSAAAVEDPGLTCRNAILIDATYDEVLYDKGAYDKVYPASITKVMTALLVLEAVDAGQLTLDTPITATAEALEVPEGSSTAKIQVGDTYTLEQYLYCLLLPSGNEVAQILAIAVDGSVEAFVDHMNQRAEELGCEGTHFANPHGYHDENHYTTAYDITRFMKAAMEYDLFQTILTSPNYTLCRRSGSSATPTPSPPTGPTPNICTARAPEARRAPPTRRATAWWRPPGRGICT